MSAIPPYGDAVAAPASKLSLWQRTVAIFVRPNQAWSGLQTQVQWWFPFLIVLSISTAGGLLLHERALIPMLSDTWDQQVANGNLTADRVDKMLEFMRSPLGIGFAVGQQVVVVAIVTFVTALVIWFGVGFLLGSRFSYRLSLETAAWSSLVNVPAQLLAFTLAWFHQTFKNLHVGLGALLPEPDPPTKLLVFAGVLLDAIGPFSIWFAVIGIIGASTLSGAPRKSVAWSLALLYGVMWVFIAALAAVFTPGS
jgi:hypothetical protein